MAKVLRYGAAVALLVGGWVHLKLYLDGYKDYPDHNLGRSFMANVVASVVVAVSSKKKPIRLTPETSAGMA